MSEAAFGRCCFVDTARDRCASLADVFCESSPRRLLSAWSDMELIDLVVAALLGFAVVDVPD